MTSGVIQGIGYIVGAIFLFYIYKTATSYGEKTKNLTKSILSGLIGAIVVAFLISSGLGSHHENCDDDPLRGSCETVQDYQPTTAQYQNSFFFWLLIIGSPITFGLYKGKKNKDNNIDDGTIPTVDEAKEILSEYGKVIEIVSGETFTKYPSMKYPISLLAHSKIKIEKSAKVVIEYEEGMIKWMEENKIFDYKKDIEATKTYVVAIKGCLARLNDFVLDEESNKANSKLLNNPSWKKATKKYRK